MDRELIESAPERAPVPALASPRVDRATRAGAPRADRVWFNTSALLAAGVTLCVLVFAGAKKAGSGSLSPKAAAARPVPHTTTSIAPAAELSRVSPVSPYGILTPLDHAAPTDVVPADSSAFNLQSDSDYASTQSDWRDAVSQEPESNLTPPKTTETVRTAPAADSSAVETSQADPNFDGSRGASPAAAPQTNDDRYRGSHYRTY